MAYITPGLNKDADGNFTCTDQYGVIRLIFDAAGGITYATPPPAPAPVLSSVPSPGNVPAGSYQYQIAWADIATGGYIAAQNASTIVLGVDSFVTVNIPPLPAFVAGGVGGGNLYTLWRSDDAGATWGNAGKHADFPTVDDGDAFLVDFVNDVGPTVVPSTTLGSTIIVGDLRIGNGIGTIPAIPAVLATGAAHNVDDVITLLQSLGLAKQA